MATRIMVVSVSCSTCNDGLTLGYVEKFDDGTVIERVDACLHCQVRAESVEHGDDGVSHDVTVSSQWTYGDLAYLTAQAQRIAQLCDMLTTPLSTRHCDQCSVAQCDLGERYCAVCLNNIVDAMAVVWDQQTQLDQGLH